MSSYCCIIFVIYSLIFATISANKCVDVDAVKDFQAEKVVGDWFLVAYNANKDDFGLNCIIIHISLYDSNSLLLNVDATDAKTGYVFKFNSTLNNANHPQDGTFNETVIEKDQTNNYIDKLIATDYDSYQIYYGCNSDGQSDYIFVLSRTRPIDDEFVQKVLDILKDKGISTDNVAVEKQDNCSD